MASYLETQIEDWRNRGVISDAVADVLLADVAETMPATRRRPLRRFSFVRIVVLFAAISFAAAILMFVSANWEAVPRIIKVFGIMAIIAAGLIGGALVGIRSGGRGRRLEEACYLVAGAAYVAGVALVGQMYHLPGELSGAMLAFALGLGFAGLMVRSYVMSVAALAAMAAWHATRPLAANLLTLEFVFFALFCAIGWAAARWLGARWMARAVIVAFVAGLGPFMLDVASTVAGFYLDLPRVLRALLWLALWAASIAGLALARYRPARIEAVPGLSRAPVAIALGAGLLAIVVLHLESGTLLPLLIVGPLALVYALFVLFAFGARSATIRWIGYVLFVGEILLLYGATVATLLGTAGFFLVVGVTLTVLAAAIYAYERRVRRPKPGGADG